MFSGPDTAGVSRGVAEKHNLLFHEGRSQLQFYY